MTVALHDDLTTVSAEAWSRTLLEGSTRAVFLTPGWQRAWWGSFGRGQMHLVVVGDAEHPDLIAPLFLDEGMLFLVGSGGSDYLDLVGATHDAQVVATAIGAAIDAAPDFVGLRLYHVPDGSSTSAVLPEVAARLGLRLYDEGEDHAPCLDLTAPDAVTAAVDKKSLRRHDAWFRREGLLEVQHLAQADQVSASLEGFFDEHVERWAGTGVASLFEDQAQRGFYRSLVEPGLAEGWLRYTVVRWDDRPVAHHFGMCFAGSYLWYKPSFAIDLARRSPGEVLLRSLLVAAAREGAHTFDFGLGDEAFKQRFASGSTTVRTWGLYP